MSGLARLVFTLFTRMQAKTRYSLQQLIEYVAGNAAAWDPPEPTKDEPNLPEIWSSELGRVDAALLSLVPHETSDENVASVLDEALASSLWQRTLQRGGPEFQNIAQTILRSRAAFIWKNSKPLERKGAFFAGVNFTTSTALEHNAAALNDALVNADLGFAAGQIEPAIKSVVDFANIAFQIEPFIPRHVPDNWEDIISEWLHGKSLADLAGGLERETVDFLEDALIYRLVWAMEAVRVRAIATKEVEDQMLTGRAATAIETGSPNYSASILIHAGLASRVGALVAVTELGADFSDARNMREWLRSEAVIGRAADPMWPTPETAAIWRDFIATIERPLTTVWEERRFEIATRWHEGPLSPGTPVRIADEDRVYSITWDPVGTLDARINLPSSGLLRARVSATSRTIEGEYIGPRFRSLR